MNESSNGIRRWTSLALASAVLGSSMTGCGGGSDGVVTSAPPAAVANVPPEAMFDIRSIGLAAVFDASASKDSDGSIAGYSWNFGELSSGANNIAETASASHTYATAGTYTVILTVTDNAGATSVRTSQVTVAPVNVAPVASFGVTTSGLNVTVDAASSTDADGSIVSYAWSFSDGTTLMPQNMRQVSHTFSSAGSYTATLVVTDNLGGQATITQPIVVSVPNQAPVSAFVATTNHLTVSVDGSTASDADGAIAEYTWNFGDPSSGTANIATGRLASKTYAAAGTYIIGLTVKDNAGAATTSSQSVTVAAANLAPVAAFSASVNGPTVTFNGSGSSDPDGSIVGYAWNFGETSSSSNTASVANPSHVYTAVGTYNVRLTVTDNRGSANTAIQPVTVTSTTVLGSGNLQFTANWSRAGDADLYVTTPTNRTIYYGNPGPNVNTDFGALDADDLVGTGPENVFWASNRTPPSGTYNVCMDTGSLNPSSGNPVTVTLNVRIPNSPVVTVSRTFTSAGNDYRPCTASSTTLLRSFVYP